MNLPTIPKVDFTKIRAAARDQVVNGLLLVGFSLISVGAGLVAFPAGVIVAGVLCVVLAWLASA